MYIKQKGTVVTQLMITQKTVGKHSGRHVCVFAVATQTSVKQYVSLKKLPSIMLIILIFSHKLMRMK